eukprot:4273660-Pleurochrysis_carterae.AAC.2
MLKRDRALPQHGLRVEFERDEAAERAYQRFAAPGALAFPAAPRRAHGAHTHGRLNLVIVEWRVGE